MDATRWRHAAGVRLSSHLITHGRRSTLLLLSLYLLALNGKTQAAVLKLLEAGWNSLRSIFVVSSMRACGPIAYTLCVHYGPNTILIRSVKYWCALRCNCRVGLPRVVLIPPNFHGNNFLAHPKLSSFFDHTRPNSFPDHTKPSSFVDHIRPSSFHHHRLQLYRPHRPRQRFRFSKSFVQSQLSRHPGAITKRRPFNGPSPSRCVQIHGITLLVITGGY